MSENIELSGKTLNVHLSEGAYDSALLIKAAKKHYADEKIETVHYTLNDQNSWDSRTLATIRSLDALAKKNGATSDYSHIPAGATKILAIAQDSIADEPKPSEASPFDPFLKIGTVTVSTLASARETGDFIVESLGSFKRFFLGKAQFQRSDLMNFIAAVGPQALPIVGLVNILLGIILAFMGAVQLQQFGAEIYVADLVALGLTREIAPMMTAIILAGRTGAAYAAQLGTMQVNEEIDALKTFGFSPMDFLVFPRMAALAIMTPLLVLYADAIGILGGYLIGMSLLNLGAVEYVVQTQNAIDITDIALGVFKGSIFGILVAITGCMQGMRSGRSASAVGDAATSAVVNGIVAIIIATAFFAVVTNMIGI